MREPKRGCSCFNEAAGIPRGRRRNPAGVPLRRPASMRPRVFPAEDAPPRPPRPRSRPSFNEAAGIPRGRPAPPHVRPQEQRRFNEAAGIPRGRLIGWLFSQSRCRPSFNEAAGIPRGRPRRGLTEEPRVTAASMRPRVFPAEDCAALSYGQHHRQRFNEAAGIPRGRRWSGTCCRVLCRRFNEAAGIPRGRLRLQKDRRKAEDRGFNEAAGIPRGRRVGDA